MGMAFAFMFYRLIRAGFISPSANETAISAYGVAAVGGLAGMFSKAGDRRAAGGIREVAGVPFTVAVAPITEKMPGTSEGPSIGPWASRCDS